MNKAARMRLVLGEEAWAVITAMTMVFLLKMPLPIERGFLRPIPIGQVHSSIRRP